MIVELFGPPGVGKTTFAIALGARLREGGSSTKLYLSSRPGEDRPRRELPARTHCHALTDPLRRIARPLMQFIAARAVRDQAYDSSARALAAKLPPGRVAALRMRQYLVRLSAAWREAQRSDRIAIFDQAYVQAMASILIASGHIADEDVMGLIAVAPRADLAIRIDAPIPEVASRLEHRAQVIGRVGRLFESKLGDPLAYARATERLQAGLERDGRVVATVSSTDPAALPIEVQRACSEIDRIRWSEKAA